MIGEAGVGKTTFINTLFNKLIIPNDHIENRYDQSTDKDSIRVTTHTALSTEGGIKLQVEVSKVLDYTSASKLNDEQFFEKLVDLVKQRHVKVYQREMRAVDKSSVGEDVACCKTEHHNCLFNAILYFIPPTFSQFTKQELKLFHELQEMSIVIPIISKADMYTVDELKDLKLLVLGALIIFIILIKRVCIFVD